MGFQALAVGGGETTVEVGGHQVDRVAAHQRPLPSTPPPGHRIPPISTVSSSRSLARPRCSSTRWLPSLIPSSVATSVGSRPSTSDGELAADAAGPERPDVLAHLSERPLERREIARVQVLDEMLLDAAAVHPSS